MPTSRPQTRKSTSRRTTKPTSSARKPELSSDGWRVVARFDGKPGEEYVVLRRATRARGRSKATKPESLLDRWTRLGVIGSIKDAPPDLSTNPKYMEGFGED